MARIGIQLMMLKEHVAQDGILPVLRRVKDTGFEVVEVSQIPMTEENVAGMEAARDELGIHFAAISAKTSAPEDSDELTLAKHFDLHVEHARRLGTKHLRIGMMPLSAMASQEAFDAFAAEADGYARRMADAGLRLSYHNHHVEFAKLGGVTLLDQLRQKAPHLRYEIDCHWVQRGGRDPERTLADFDGVLELVHLKDYRITLPPTEVLAAAAGGNRSAFTRFWGGEIVQFAEVGQGTLDWKPVIEQALASGAQHLLIEQDQTYGRDIFDSLTMSREHLVSLGFGALITG